MVQRSTTCGDHARKTTTALDSLDRRRFLRGTIGAAAAAAAVPALSGLAAAYFPAELDIDVQPNNEDNYIDLDEDDHIPVAVLPSEFLNSDGERETFDPTKEDVRYRFGSRSALDDGNGARPVDDGEVVTMEVGHGDQAESHDVLLLQFPVTETGLDSADDVAWLYWDRDKSREHGYSGFDTVTVVGGEPSDQDIIDLLRRLVEALTAGSR